MGRGASKRGRVESSGGGGRAEGIEIVEAEGETASGRAGGRGVGDLGKERAKGFGKGNGWEEEVPWGVATAGGVIGWIASARNVSRESDEVPFVEEGVDAAEDEVDVSVATTPVLPPVDNASVVTIDAKVRLAGEGSVDAEEGADKELKADGLSPSDVPTLSAPSWE